MNRRSVTRRYLERRQRHVSPCRPAVAVAASRGWLRPAGQPRREHRMPARHRMAAVAAAAGGRRCRWRSGTAVPAASAQPTGPTAYLSHFSKLTTIASTVPHNGDVNPYGIVVIRHSTGRLRAGNVLISNFNNKANLQGTGKTIVQITPGGHRTLFAQHQPQQAAGPMPRRRRPEHRTRGAAGRLGRGRQRAIQERHGRHGQGRLPDRAEQPGPGQGDHQRLRHQRPVGLDRRGCAATSRTCSSPTC